MTDEKMLPGTENHPAETPQTDDEHIDGSDIDYTENPTSDEDLPI